VRQLLIQGGLKFDTSTTFRRIVPNDRFELSPLLKGVGTDFLEPVIQTRVHAAIARAYMTARTVTPLRAIDIAFHLIGARQWRLLTGFLFQVAQHIDSVEQAKSFEILPAMFRPTFPANLTIPLGTRIALRAVQARVALFTEGKTQLLLQDLRTLTETVEQNGQTEAFVGWLLVGPFNPAAPVSVCAEGVIRASRLAPQVALLRMADLPMPVESLIWASIPNLRSAKDADAFVDAIVAMTNAELRNAFIDERLRTGIEIVAGKCVSVELALPEQERDWLRPLRRLDQLLARGQAAGIVAITDAAEREKATVLSDFLGQPELAIEILTANRDQRAPAERMRRDHLAAAILLDHVSTEAAMERYELALQGDPPMKIR